MGTALAIDLSQRGVTCQLIERHSNPQNIPKGQNLTQRTMEYLARLGVENQVRQARPISASGTGGMTIYGALTSGIEYDWMIRSQLSGFYHRTSERLPQPATETALRSRLASLGADTAYGWTASITEVAEDHVRIESVNRDGETVVSAGRFLIGCDGSASRIRQSAGIAQTRVDHDRRMALIVFRSTELDALVASHPDRQFFSVIAPRHSGYWQFFGRVDSNSRWFFHAPVSHEGEAESLDVSALIAAAAGQRVTLETEYVGFWDLRFASADRYRHGRVFVAGDAAHSHPPYGGYGINTGFEDAGNLAWKLEVALRTGNDEILESYDEERRPIFESTAADFIDRSIREDRSFLQRFHPEDGEAFEAEWRRRAALAASEVDRYAPHYGGSSLIIGGDGITSTVSDHQILARPGHHLAPWRSGDTSLLDSFGTGFTLLTTAPALSAVLSEEAARLRVGLQVVSIPPEAAEAYGAERILVRPDLYIAATAVDDDEVRRALAIAAGQAPAKPAGRAPE